MREVGWKPNARHAGYAALAGVIASVVIGIPMAMMGALTDMVAGLVGSDSIVVGWIIHLLAGALFAAPFGLLVWTRSIGKGIAYGLLYGLIIGVVFAWFAVFSILGMPLDPTMQPAVMDIGLHILWGGIVGGIYAAMVGREQPVAERHRTIRPRSV